MSRKILLVEDEADIREIATLSLESVAGWTAVAASCGKEAVTLAAEHRPDAILLDVMMPDMDGPTTLNALRADTRTAAIPVIFMTAKVQAADRRQLDALGASGIIAKPFDPLKLAGEISAILGWE